MVTCPPHGLINDWGDSSHTCTVYLVCYFIWTIVSEIKDCIYTHTAEFWTLKPIYFSWQNDSIENVIVLYIALFFHISPKYDLVIINHGAKHRVSLASGIRLSLILNCTGSCSPSSSQASDSFIFIALCISHLPEHFLLRTYWSGAAAVHRVSMLF